MNRILIAISAMIFLSACCAHNDMCGQYRPPPTAIGYSHECTVKDSDGRKWVWRGSHYACRKAIHDCERFQVEDRFRKNHNCMIVKEV